MWNGNCVFDGSSLDLSRPHLALTRVMSVCACMLHGTNLGPTVPAGITRALWGKAFFNLVSVNHSVTLPRKSSFRQKRSLGSSRRRQHNNIIMVQLGSNLSTCELRNHCRSDPVQVQSTARAHLPQALPNAKQTPRCFKVGPKHL